MKERLRVLALAIGALALFYVLVFPKPQSNQGGPALPLSTEAAPEGLLALWQWLHAQQIPALSLRRHYDYLDTLTGGRGGNVLIMSLPQRNPAAGPDIDDLRTWVDHGNTVLVLAAFTDSPLWSLGIDVRAAAHLERLTGLSFGPPQGGSQPVDARKLFQTRISLKPRAPHPLLAGVRSVTALSALPVNRSVLTQEPETPPLQLAVRGDTGDTVLWLSAQGEGQFIISTAASLFSNQAVLLDDNARLLANLLAWSRTQGGAVIFDDSHQGLTDYYDAAAFYADPRLHRTLGWIVLLWLVLVVGSQRLRAPTSRWRPPDETSFVDASARYLSAVVPEPAVAQRLIELFLGRLARRSGTDGVAAGLELLQAHAGIARTQAAALGEIYARACNGRRVDLKRLQNLLSQMQRILE